MRIKAPFKVSITGRLRRVSVRTFGLTHTTKGLRWMYWNREIHPLNRGGYIGSVSRVNPKIEQMRERAWQRRQAKSRSKEVRNEIK